MNPTTPPDPPQPACGDLAAETLRFARERLGPASERLLLDPAVQTVVLSRVRNGRDVEDAVLAEVHRASSSDRAVADEFLAHFLDDLLRVGHRLRSSAIERFLDSGDLVQSILGDLWRDLDKVRFETRGEFFAYLSRRLGWKASDRARGARSARRREDCRVGGDPQDLGLEGTKTGPHSAAVRAEERDRLALLLVRLPARDRELLVNHLRGLGVQEIADRMGISYDSARVGLQRAIRKARRYGRYGG